MLQVRKNNIILLISFLIIIGLSVTSFVIFAETLTPTMLADVVVVGSGAVGQGAVKILTKKMNPSKIVWISKEVYLPYNKCNLKDYLVSTKTKNLDIMSVSSKLQKRFGYTVVWIDPSHKLIAIKTLNGSNGISTATAEKLEIIQYKKLLLGTGVTNKKLEITDHTVDEFENIFSYYSLTDADNILRYIRKNNVKKVAVIGTGVNGLECASSLHEMGIHVSIIGRKSDILSKLLEPHESQFLKRLIQNNFKNEVSFYTIPDKVKVTQEKQSNSARVSAIQLPGGKHLDIDMIIYTIGVTPNSTFTDPQGKRVALDVDKFGYIKTNPYLQTNIQDVYAAGDAALIYNRVWHKNTPSVKWSEGLEEGECAAENIVKQGQCRFQGIVATVMTKPFGYRVVMAPQYLDVDLKVTKIEKYPMYLRVSVDKDNTLKSFALINPDASIFAKVRGAFLDQKPVDTKTLLSGGFSKGGFFGKE